MKNGDACMNICVCECVCACARACVRACVRARVRVCVCKPDEQRCYIEDLGE